MSNQSTQAQAQALNCHLLAASASRWRRLTATFLVVAVAAGGGLLTLVTGHCIASAQENSSTYEWLERSKCDTSEGIPAPGGNEGIVSELRRECKILVDAYNQWVFHPDSVTESGSTKHLILTDPPAYRIGEHVIDPVPWGKGLFWRWNGLEVLSLDGQIGVRGLWIFGATRDASTGGLLAEPIGLAGEIPQSLCQLGRLQGIIMAYNYYTGGIPACFGDLTSLRLLELSFNELSGSIPSRLASNLTSNFALFGASENNLVGNLPEGFVGAKWINLAANFLTGPLPVNIGGPSLRALDLSNNSFNSKIPGAYASKFSRVSQLHLNNNDLYGDFDVGWLNQINFLNMPSRPALDISGNRLCIDTSIPITPRPLVPPIKPSDEEGSEVSLVEAETDTITPVLFENVDNRGNQITHPYADISLHSNICEESSSPSYSQFVLPPVTNLQKSLTATNLSLNWDAPVNPATNTPYSVHGYIIHIREAKAGVFNEDGMLKINDTAERSRGRITVQGFTSVVFDPDGGDHSPTSLQVPLQGENGLLRPGQSVSADELVVNVQPYYLATESGSGLTNVFHGSHNAWQNGGWRAFNVLEDGTSARELARNIGLDQYTEAYSWDSENQQWSTHPTQGDESGFLSQGTAVMFRRGVVQADNLKFAGLSRADENMVLTLRQGWNLLAPATDNFEVVSDNPYVVFEENLVDCENLAGVLAIITYDSMTKEFKLALPCHPNVLPSGYQELDAIDSRDTMYVFFESQLSVPITWDITSQRYGSA